jgi:hypothetical protein
MRRYRPVPKPLGDRVVELVQSLQVIRDSLDGVSKGRLHQFIPLYGQLRALLSEKSKGNRPLLLDLAAEVGVNLELFCMPGIDAPGLPDSIKDKLILHLSGLPVSVEQEHPNQRAVGINEFLDLKLVLYHGRTYTPRDIIAWFANKAGGAHYSPDLPNDFSELLSFGLGGQPILINALRQIAEATFRLGLLLLQREVDFETHLLVYVPPQSLDEPAYILDYRYSVAQMRIFCRMDPGMRLVFGVTSIQGTSAAVGVQRLMDWTKPHYFRLSSVLREDMSTTLSILADGENAAELAVPYPLFVSNNPANYHRYVNRSQESEVAGLRFGFVGMAMYGRALHFREQAELFRYFEEQLTTAEQSCVYFRPGQFGYAAPDAPELKMENGPVKWSLSRALKGEFPPEPST